MDYRVISADDHIDLPFLPQDLWQKRVPEKYRDRAPRVTEVDGELYWVCGDEKWDTWSLKPGTTSIRGGRRHALEKGGVLEYGVLRPTTTELRLADMDRDGIDATVMYGPIVPLFIKDPDLRRACYRAYNDWLAEFCATAPDRLIGVGLLPIDDAEAAADELRYLKQIGLRQSMFLAARANPPLWQKFWEPLWQAGEETGLPIGFHLGGGVRSAIDGPEGNTVGNVGVRVACGTMQLDEALACLTFGGVFERYPGLKVVLAETGIGWIPYLLERMDDTFNRIVDAKEYWNRYGGIPLTKMPSEYFRRQVWATFQLDHVGLRLLDLVGEDRVMWASDYPHADSTFPESQKAIEEQFRGIAPETRRRVLCENARQLYGLGGSGNGQAVGARDSGLASRA